MRICAITFSAGGVPVRWVVELDIEYSGAEDAVVTAPTGSPAMSSVALDGSMVSTSIALPCQFGSVTDATTM